MKDKVTLTEQYVIVGEVSKSLQIDLNYIKNNIVKNYSFDECQNPSDFSYRKDYYNLSDDVNITWLTDYIRDHYNLEHKKTPIIMERAGLFLPQGKSINYHNHIDSYDLIGSPYMSCIYTVDCGEEPSYVIFEYSQGRLQDKKYKIKLKKNQYVLFSSELRHEITENKNKKPMINLSLKFEFKL